MYDNVLKWTYNTLRGLHTNKNSFHLDRNGFLEYYNIENLKNFSRLRRGGASRIANQFNIGTYDINKIPIKAIDFTYVDNVNNEHKRILCLSAQRAFYTLESGNLYSLTLPTMSGDIDNIFTKWSMIPFKNRLLMCTGIHNTWKNSDIISISADKRTFTGFSSLPSDINPGDYLIVDGINLRIKDRTSNTIIVDQDYTASRKTGITNWRILKTKVANFLIFDPTDTRDKSGKSYDYRIYHCGALPPPTQIVYDTTVYYDQHSTYGWIYRGKANYGSYITARTGSQDIIIKNMADDITSLVQGGDYIYIDDVEYEIDSISYSSIDNGTLTITIKNPDGFRELTIDNYYIATLNNYKGNGLDHWWGIFYGELETISGGYKYGYAYYNSKTGHISNLSPLAEIKNPYKKFNIAITSWNHLYDNDPMPHYEYDTIIFFRSVDGGVLLYESGRLSSTTIPSGYTTYFYDDKLDSELGPLIGEQYYNSPPPEFLAIEEWNGRIWGISSLERDKLYYSMDEVQLSSRSNTGRAEECYPATNYLVIPAEDGKITGIKKAGDYLYVGTDKNLYVVIGYDELTFKLEKILAGYGIKQEAMCEYSGPLSKRPGLFFVSNNYQAFIITPDMIKNVGEPIEDLLIEAAYNDSMVEVSKINTSLRQNFLIWSNYSYESIKARNYIIVSFITDDITPIRKTYAYDIDFDEWYEIDFKYGSGTNEVFVPLFSTTNIFGFPIAMGCYLDYYLGQYYITLLSIFNDAYYMDDEQSYSAYLRTSWIDFDNRELLKALVLGKIFSPIQSGNFSTTLYKDEESNPMTLKSSQYSYQEYPFQEGKEYSLVYLDNTASQILGHLFSVKIIYPSLAIKEQIYNIEFLFQRLGVVTNER